MSASSAGDEPNTAPWQLRQLFGGSILPVEPVTFGRYRAASPRATLPADPCACRKVPGAKRFKASAIACDNKPAADNMLFNFDEYCLEPGALEALSPADLNNVACALVWQTGASTASAERALTLLEMADKNKPDEATAKIIAGNRQALLPIRTESPPILGIIQGESLYKLADEATDAPAKEGE